jgi:uncharacterized membrane protein YeiH
MAAEALEIPLAINVAAVFVGALGGAVRAGEDERVDIVGVLTLATVMGFGGGIIRDVLLGNLPPAVLRDAWYIIAVVVAAALGALFLHYLRKLGKVLWVLDSLSIGLFACVGTNAALLAGLSILPAVLIGTLASVGGLILTDIFQGRPSSIMHQGPPNAAAGLAGAFAYALLYTGDHVVLTSAVAIAVTFAVRLAGPVLHVQVPQPRRRAYELEQRLRAKAAKRRSK